MDEIRRRLEEARPSNWQIWPSLRRLGPWFAALGLVLLLAIPWGIRRIERNLEEHSRETLTDAGFVIEDISFTGRRATIVANLSTDEQNSAVTALAAMGGVASVTWEEGTMVIPAATPTTTTVTTTTAEPEPGAEMTIAVENGRIKLTGVLPAAGALKDVGDAAADMWGDAVVNDLSVDPAVLAQPWLTTVDAAIAPLTLLIDAELSLDAAGATVRGIATTEARRDAAVTRLDTALGTAVELTDEVTVTALDMPQVEVTATGDGTVTLEGTVANLAVRKAIARSVNQSGDDIDVQNQIELTENTADVYVLRRLPDVIEPLATARQWVLRSDGRGLAGIAVAGKAFNGDRVKPTAALVDLIDVLGGIMQADPSLVIDIEVHANPRQEADAATLALQRAEAIGAALIRAGIDPARVSAGNGDGEGELLRFLLIPAE